MTVKLYPALLIDNFEHGSTRLWTETDSGNGTISMELHSGKYVKSGRNSLHMDMTTGSTQSGTLLVDHWFNMHYTTKDFSDYTHAAFWVYSACTRNPPVLIHRFLNDATWSTWAYCSGLVTNGWGVATVALPSARNNVEQFRLLIDETDYGSSEDVDLYIDGICLIDNDNAFDLSNTDENISEEDTYQVREIPIAHGLKDTMDMGRHPRMFSVTGILPTTTTSALEREAQLEDLVLGGNEFYFHSDVFSGLVKIITYTSTVVAGAIDTVSYTLGLVEDFGSIHIVR